MTYATLDQLTKRFGEQLLVQLTDRAQLGAIDADVVAEELAKTDAVIDGYLLGRYQLPIVGTVPEQLSDLALSIAIYKLHTYSPEPKIKDDYDSALKTLALIASGTIRLQIAGIEAPSSGAEGVQFIDRDRALTPENLRGFI